MHKCACRRKTTFYQLTHSFFQGGWHFPENPKIGGDTDPFFKSGKILKSIIMAHEQEFVFFLNNIRQLNSDGIQFLLPKSFFSRKQPISVAERERTSNRDSLLCLNAKQTFVVQILKEFFMSFVLPKPAPNQRLFVFPSAIRTVTHC